MIAVHCESTCLKNKKFNPCPSIQESYSHQLEFAQNCTHFVLPVYCVCRMPYFDDGQNTNLHMAECDQCGMWYHKSCVDIPENVFKKQTRLWICPKC